MSVSTEKNRNSAAAASIPLPARAAGAGISATELLSAQLEIAYHRMYLNLLMTLAAAIVFVGLMAPFFTRAQTIAWFSVLVLVCAFRYFVWRAHARALNPIRRATSSGRPGASSARLRVAPAGLSAACS